MLDCAPHISGTIAADELGLLLASLGHSHSEDELHGHKGAAFFVVLTPSLLFSQCMCPVFINIDRDSACVPCVSSTEIVHELDAGGTRAIEWQEFVRHMVDIGHDGR